MERKFSFDVKLRVTGTLQDEKYQNTDMISVRRIELALDPDPLGKKSTKLEADLQDALKKYLKTIQFTVVGVDQVKTIDFPILLHNRRNMTPL